ncbi:endonuclease [Roseibium aquae]|uniref:Endonuclease n=1 Tax=Roseibium aquae TaxID=1323746 RepID=A0A916X154_9HYPH|nr:hypothetical protein [Roseibium aquae]GGB53182.1 endonuclease [Roseibium aquae]
MDTLKIAFWNLQNLFDTTESEIAADLEFTPAAGWTPEAVDAKFENLIEVLAGLFDGTGPDLLGVCEIENEALLQRLADGLNAALNRTDLVIASDESADIRGIDCGLIYSANQFDLNGDPVGHLVHFRYPTRDIFEVPLRVKSNGAELVVYVTHWPSRRGNAEGSEAFRIAVASHLGRLVDAQLKLDLETLLSEENLEPLFDDMKARWNRNILIMGDLNDDPFNRSVMAELRASNSLDGIEEEMKLPQDDRLNPDPQKRKKSDVARYVGQEADLYNLSWGPLGVSGAGTIFFSPRDHKRSKQMFDQMIVSRGLALGLSGLQMVEDDFAIAAPKVMWTNSSLPGDAPRHRVRPKAFDPASGKGYSDHFPVTGSLRVESGQDG